MTVAATPPSPKVDDAYWFELSEDLVTKSLGRHEAAAEKIQNLVLWLWTIYTASAGVGTALAGKDLPLWVLFIVALASAALIAVYVGTVWVQAPIGTKFDPRSPDEISYAFGSILAKRQERFQITLAGMFLAAFMVTVAIMLMSTVREDKIGAPQLTAMIVKSRIGTELIVLATVEKGVTVRLRTEPADGGKGEETERMLLPTEAGILQASILLERPPPQIRVSITWTGQDGSAKELSRNVEVSK